VAKYSVVSIPTDLFVRLLQHLHSPGSSFVDPDAAVAEAVEQWLKGQGTHLLDEDMWTEEYEGHLAEDYARYLIEDQPRGYAWKGLWLPDGTDLRMRYKGKTFYAQVRGDDLLYDGAPSSPAQMVNSITRTNRNAWRDLWIKTPRDKEFIPAEQARIRSEERTAELARKYGRKTKQAPDALGRDGSSGDSEISSEGLFRP
jgi:hypothetical protein